MKKNKNTKTTKNDGNIQIDTNLGIATIKLVMLKDNQIREIEMMKSYTDVDKIDANDVVEYLDEKEIINLSDSLWMQDGKDAKSLTVMGNDGTTVRYDFSIINHMKERTSARIPLVQFEEGDINYIVEHKDEYGLDNINQVGAEAIISYLDAMKEININDSQFMSCGGHKYALTVQNADGSTVCYDYSIIEKMKKMVKKNK